MAKRHPSPEEETAVTLPVRSGQVVREELGHYWVECGAETFRCRIANILRKSLQFSTADPASSARRVQRVRARRRGSPVVVGDRVEFVVSDEAEGEGQIRVVMPRSNHLSRRAAGRKPIEQVLVANLDQMMIVFAWHAPDPSFRLLDRFLVTGEAQGLSPCICINKIDLASDEEKELEAALVPYRETGYPILLTCALDGTGLDELRRTLTGRLSVLVGPSGVGKSSLLNSLDPSLHIRAGEISEATGKGRHTTTHLELYELDDTTRIIDTPGLRELGLWGVTAEELACHFPEMEALVEGCRFAPDCSHVPEPGCAIKVAVEDGRVSPARYDSYVALHLELTEIEKDQYP